MKNKPIRVSDVVDMPEKKVVQQDIGGCGDVGKNHCYGCGRCNIDEGFNQGIDKISQLKVSPDKLREMGWVRKTEVELDTYEIALLARRILELDCDCDPKLGNDFVVCENCLSLRRFKEELANKTQDIIK